jgi:hypothetical protein
LCRKEGDVLGDYINNIAQIVIIAGFIGGGINYFIIQPLGSAIAALKETIQDLQKMIREGESARQEMDKRLVRVEESTKSAHHRMDGLEEVIRDIEK